MYVAWTLEPPLVYMTCATGSPGHKIEACTDCEGVRHCKVVNKHSQTLDGVVQPLEEVVSKFVHWAMLTKEDLDDIW